MDNLQGEVFLDTGLDPGLLSLPYQVRTNWCVIEGAPCSGKTTMIDLLERKGFRTNPETGRRYIEQEFARGRSLEEIRTDAAAFCLLISRLQLEAEAGLAPEETIFLDRAIPGCLSFTRQCGLDPNALLPDCFRHRYASVFLLDRFPTRKDEARIEDEKAAVFLDKWTYRDYSALGYAVIRVPVLPPEERVGFILERWAGREDSQAA
jgi:predicted ATPase